MKKTSLKKLVENIDFTNEYLECYPDFGGLAEEFNITCVLWDNSDRLKGYFMRTHLCTDTQVGLAAFFLDGELVYFTNQEARKARVEYTFISKDAADKVSRYLLELSKDSGREPQILTEGSMESETIDDQYSIQYASQILHNYGYYRGQKVKIKNTFRRVYTGSFRDVEIVDGNGKKMIVDCRDMLFDYNTLD